MRVIAGTAGGIQLKSIKGRNVRPTLDRVKESLFSMIAYYIVDAVVLDLFAGFGNLGIEALSRGAKEAEFVEIKSKHTALIEENLNKCNLAEKARVVRSDVYKYLGSTFKKYDLIFMDPPYNKKLADKAVQLILKNEILNKNGILIIEKSTEEEIKNYQELEIIKSRDYGNTLILIYKLI
ncbi:16S rRNA (guanine(966)-N(2))-methyltransferase RsmD [Halanaerobium hydrogeniformans]|uniref:Methyltransferase n=1 Tax=Halanaerobium hydrogeniformans TaxID=656519 RepID=E4RLS6_HALHG|nr:16S rRNA (guanine(966)-N(2))-methyltransferase RsmD [Halanaerobium hydrogeniformans]ADQ14990.1 methyltransferase [Halanaerobium hydrogeniformans]